MTAIKNISRRNFIKNTALIGGGFLLSFSLPQLAKAGGRGNGSTEFSPNAFLVIKEDNTVVIICPYAEMGQGIYTAICQMIGEELELDWQKIKVESAPIDPAYNHLLFHCQMTGASASVSAEYDRMRRVGAAARYMLVAAAAEQWGITPEDCKTANGIVTNIKTGKTITYGSLISRATKIIPPKELPLKTKTEQSLIGKSVKRLDSPPKTNGTAVYGIDISLPGMLVAVITRSQAGLGKVKSVDDSKAKAYPGVKAVINLGKMVAVVATGYWQAEQARQLLEISWDMGEYENFSTANEMAQYKKDVQSPGMVAVKKGDVSTRVPGGKSFLKEFEFPYLTAAVMEPLNCVADVKADSCDIYVGTQGQTFDTYGCAGALKMDPKNVRIHSQLCGGGFGRRCQMDAHMAVEAALLSQIMKTPIKVIWSRKDDMQSGYYRFANYHRIEITTDATGNPDSWYHRIAIPSFVFGTPFEGPIVKNGIDFFQLDGALDPVYKINHLQVEWLKEKQTIPGIWQRANAHFYNAYIKETMIDLLAKDAHKDPYQYRLDLLKEKTRHTAVLKKAADKAGWAKPLPAGHARGMAIHENFGSVMASVVEVSINSKGRPVIHRIVSALDCGVAVNPSIVDAQLQGGTVWGISQALYGDLQVVNGQVSVTNYNDFKVARMFEIPVMENYIVESTSRIAGVGEASVACLAPALANALMVLTGNHFTKMPFPADVRNKI